MKYFILSIASVLLLAGCGGDDAPTAADLDTAVPTDIAETPVGAFDCQTNADCTDDEWCYATAEFAACTQK